MNQNLARNMTRYLKSLRTEAAAEQEQGQYGKRKGMGKEVEREAEVQAQKEIAPILTSCKGKGKERGVASPPPPPPPPSMPSHPLKPRGKTSPRLHIPARIWNQFTAKGPGEAKNLKRGRTDSNVEQEEQGKKGKRMRKQIKAGHNNSEVGESFCIGAASSARVVPHPKRFNALQLNTSVAAATAVAAAAAASSSKSVPPPSLPPPTRACNTRCPKPKPVPVQPTDYEGPKSAWRRLFPGEGEMADYKGAPDAWHEKMVWQQEEPGRGWRARREGEMYVRRYLGIARDWERKERVARLGVKVAG